MLLMRNVYRVLVSHEGYVTGVTITRPADDLRTLNLAKAGYLRLLEVVEDVTGSGDLAGAGVRGDVADELTEVVDEPGGSESDLGTPRSPARRKTSGSGRRKSGTAGQQEDGPEESGAPVGLPEAEVGSETGGFDQPVEDGDDRD